MTAFDEYKLAIEHIEKLLDRRQITTSFYLSVNTGVSVVIGFLLQHGSLTDVWMTVAILMLLVAGLLACWIWMSLLNRYEILIGWWYTLIRELEATMTGGSQIFTREYQELHGNGNKHFNKTGLTQRERTLSWIFTTIYLAFTLGFVWTHIIH